MILQEGLIAVSLQVQTCHSDTLSAYTCYDCHEHDPAGTEQEHREEGISDFQDCVCCHPTGQEDEGDDG